MKNPVEVPCSAILCVRNEEKRLIRGLTNVQLLPLDEVIVVDGNSEDRTWEMLEDFENLTLIQGGSDGLLTQRIAGIEKARNDVLLIIDIDDNISLIDFTTAYEELTSNSRIDGLQFSLQSDGQAWFSRAWSNYLSIANPPQQTIPMLGRPCLTYRHHYANLVVPKEKILSDDLWLKFNMPVEAKTFITSNAKTLRDFPTSFAENFQKFVEYGLSDYSIAKTRSIRLELLWHSFWRIALLRTVMSMRPRTWQYFPFPLMHGLVRGFSHLVTIAKLDPRLFPREPTGKSRIVFERIMKLSKRAPGSVKI